MAAATSTEYLTIAGIPLTALGWTTENISGVLDGPGVRGTDLINPTRAGEIPRRRILAARSFSVPIVVNGYYDADDNPSSDPRATLLENLDYLKTALAPNFISTTGTRTFEWVTPDFTRQGAVHVNPAVSVETIGIHAARLVLDVTLPGGVLRDDEESNLQVNVSQNATTVTHSIDVPGNSEIQDVRIEYVKQGAGSLDATSFKITNLSYDAGGGVYVFYDDAVVNTLTIYGDTYTATHGATAVGGSIVNAGSAIWLPLLPGTNSIKIDVPGNTVHGHVRLHVRGAWA